MKQIIINEKAPKAIGPYSSSIKIGSFLFVSGQLPVNPEKGELIKGTIEDKTRRVLENLKLVLLPYKIGLENVVKTTIFLKDINHFARVNEIYGQYFQEEPPARSCVQVSQLPKDAEIEIEAIAYCN